MAGFHKLLVAETGIFNESERGKQLSVVDIELDDQLILQSHSLDCSPEEDPQQQPQNVIKLLMSLDKRLSSIEGDLIVQVRASHNEQGGGQGHANIHSITWERLQVLEGLNLKVDRIHVVRTVPMPTLPPSFVHLKDQTLSKPRQEKRAFNILYVISRRLPVGSRGKYTDLAPDLILHVFQIVAEQANNRDLPYHINLHVLPSATPQSLVDILERAKQEGGPGYFNLLHLDGHGYVENSTSFFRFKSENQGMDENRQDFFEDVSSDRIAQMLKGHGIRYFVSNACDSAKEMGELRANLSLVLLKSGASNVVGMSHYLSEAAAERFFPVFYGQWLASGLPLMEAFASGVAELHRNRQWLDSPRSEITVPSWVVPNRYSDGSSADMLTISHAGVSVSSVALDSKKLRAGKVKEFIGRCQDKRPGYRCLKKGYEKKSEGKKIALWFDGQTMGLLRDMELDHIVYLQDRAPGRVSQYLDLLSHFWTSTNFNFIKRVYRFTPQTFIDWSSPSNIVQRWMHKRWPKDEAFLNPSNISEEVRCYRFPDTIIIIEDLDKFHPAAETSKGRMTPEQREAWKTAFEEFVHNLVTFQHALAPANTSEQCPWRPYLIFAGESSLADCIEHVPCLRRINPTPYDRTDTPLRTYALSGPLIPE